MIAPYLTFQGKTDEAFNFYRSALGGEFLSVQRFGDTPHGESMSAEDKQLIMHISLQTPLGTIMGNDHLDFMGMYQAGNNFSISVHPTKVEDAQKIFDALAAGGNTLMPLEKAFWGAYFGMLIDKYGIKWVINCQA